MLTVIRAFTSLVFIATIFYGSGLSAQTSSSDGHSEQLKIQPDLPYLTRERKLIADLSYTAASEFTDTVSLSFFIYNSKGDSTLLCKRKGEVVRFKAGTNTQAISFVAADPNSSFILPVFQTIIRKTGGLPAGSYKAFLILPSGGAGLTTKTYTYAVDSALPATSPLKKSLTDALLPKAVPGATNLITAAKAIERNALKIDRIIKAKGLTPQVVKAGDKQFVNLWYEEWFIGRYELEAGKSISSQISRQKEQIGGNISSLANNELEGYRSLRSQVRDLRKQKKDDKELSGQIGLSAVWANRQPEYSAQDNNYYELRGDFETEVMEIPIGIEAYYTTQDAHRSVKSSYFRVHYDADKAKAELLKLISGFKQQYSNTAAKGKGLEQVYGSYLAGLKDSKGSILGEIKSESGGYSFDGGIVDENALKASIQASLETKMKDTAGLVNGAGAHLDSAGKARATAARGKAIADSAQRLYTKAMKRYAQAQEIEKKIGKYSGLLEQYKNTSYFDSALAYAKVEDLKNADDASYKDLAKRASGLLPEGKAKTFAAGLTSLDAGIFPKYVSKYTMAGQQVKGLDVGYDIGFAEIGFTTGKTEYAGRDGSLDKYSTYGARVLFQPIKEQKIGLVYYGYTPSRSAINNDKEFYKNIGIALPTFRQPVHIVSATYEATLAKNIQLDGEIATSYRNGVSKSFASGFDADRIAWHLNAEGAIPKTSFALTGSYEHGGKEFQNSTLPVLISGTDLYKVGLKGAAFRGFLTGGITFNHAVQNSFYTRGGNSRWGFEIATHSKQYPSVALSYKPFATFRSEADTFAVPQRQLTGAVWTGKANYQVKRSGGRVWRFSTVYNRSFSQSDSASYGSNLAQLNIAYNNKKWMITGSAGQSMLHTSGIAMPRPDSLNPAHLKTNFGMGSVGYSLSKQMSVSGGADIGFAPFGLSKYGVNGGVSYRMKKAPLSLRTFARYSGYRLPGYSGVTRSDASTDAIVQNSRDQTERMAWRKMISGGIDLVWQFKMKINQ